MSLVDLTIPPISTALKNLSLVETREVDFLKTLTYPSACSKNE